MTKLHQIKSVPNDVRERFYFVIPMPVNKDGQGPAKIGHDAVEVEFEVWTQELDTVYSSKLLLDAIQECEKLNRAYYNVPSL